MAVTYCTDKDVRRILQSAFYFDGSTEPSKSQVEDFINAAEDEIDKETHQAWRLRYSGTDTGRDATAKYVYLDIPATSRNSLFSGVAWARIKFPHRKLRTLTSGTDVVEIWDGSQYVEYLSTKTEGRGSGGDFWYDDQEGVLYVRASNLRYREKALRTKYRYGGTVVPYDIRDACAMLAAALLITNDDTIQLVSDTNNPLFTDMQSKASQWKKGAYRKIAKHTEWVAIRP